MASVKKIVDVSELPPNMLSNRKKTSMGVELFSQKTKAKSLKAKLESVEQSILQEAMARLGNLTAVAEELKIDRTTVFRKMKKYEQKQKK